MFIGVVQMPLQLFTSLVGSSTLGDMVGGGFFRSDSPSFVLSAANKALKSGLSSLAFKTLVSSSMVSSRPYLGATCCGEKARSAHTPVWAISLMKAS